MTSYERFLAKVEAYHASHRRSDSAPLTVGPLYDLYPQLGTPSIPCELQWPNAWANLDRQGVYAFFDADGQLLYVGKASMGNDFGARLAAYCMYEVDRSCKLKHAGWSRTPRYVLTVAVPKDTPWEAPALEEFLIDKLQPSDNVTGRSR